MATKRESFDGMMNAVAGANAMLRCRAATQEVVFAIP